MIVPCSFYIKQTEKKQSPRWSAIECYFILSVYPCMSQVKGWSLLLNNNVREKYMFV